MNWMFHIWSTHTNPAAYHPNTRTQHREQTGHREDSQYRRDTRTVRHRVKRDREGGRDKRDVACREGQTHQIMGCRIAAPGAIRHPIIGHASDRHLTWTTSGPNNYMSSRGAQQSFKSVAGGPEGNVPQKETRLMIETNVLTAVL